MALKDVLMNVVGSLFTRDSKSAVKSEIIDTTDINKIPKAMLDELSNGKGDDE